MSILIILVLIIVVVLIVLKMRKKKTSKYEIKGVPNNYIVKFVGDSNFTYVYKIDNGREDYGFKYINLTDTKITDKGEAGFKDDVFAIAKINKAYNYVVLHDGTKMTISEFIDSFARREMDE